MKYLGGRGLIVSIVVAGIVLTTGQRVSQAAAEKAQTMILNPGDIILHWTATGDDGNTGRATSYDVRYLPVNVGPINSDERWNQAIQLNGEPIPSRSGQPDSMLVTGLVPGARYYFCIKAIDEAGNASDLSNSPEIMASPGDFIPGDANNSGAVSGLDLVFMVNYFKGGQPIPDPILRADCNGNCVVNGSDVIYLLAFLHGGGPSPVRGNCAPLLSNPDSSKNAQNY
jgi:hypothetical protein